MKIKGRSLLSAVFAVALMAGSGTTATAQSSSSFLFGNPQETNAQPSVPTQQAGNEAQQQAAAESPIQERYRLSGGETGPLGYPVAPETPTLGAKGKRRDFEGGVILWTPETGAHVIDGLIHFVWNRAGGEASSYGYPISEAFYNENQDLVQDFQSGRINLTDAITKAGTRQVNGEEISALLLDYEAEAGIRSAEGTPTLQKNWVTRNGGVTIPRNYVYDPRRGSLHDYCTKSPDYFYPAWNSRSNVRADFRGPCARHDMCYARYKNGRDRANCNRAFFGDLNRVCNGAYRSGSREGSDCRRRSQVYYNTVIAVHPSHWPGHARR